MPTSINDLPDDLLIQILSLLPVIYAIRCSVLSRKWRNLWRSITNLDFDFRHWDLCTPSFLPNAPQAFAGFINKTLLLHQPDTPLQKFHLLYPNNPNHRHYADVNSWLRYALSSHVSDLELSFFAEINEIYPLFELNFSIFKNSSVRVFKLSNAILKFPSIFSVSAHSFVSLRSLKLSYVHITGKGVSDLISKCINLEILHLESISVWEPLKICLPKLIELKVWCCAQLTLEISSPRLRVISIIVHPIELCSADLPSLVEANLQFVHGHIAYGEPWIQSLALFRGVKKLKVPNCFHEAVARYRVFPRDFKFLNLKYLEMSTGFGRGDLEGLCIIFELSPLLESLVLDHCYRAVDEDEMVDQMFVFDIPKLRFVEMRNFRASRIENHVRVMLKNSSKVLEKLVVLPAKTRLRHC